MAMLVSMMFASENTSAYGWYISRDTKEGARKRTFVSYLLLYVVTRGITTFVKYGYRMLRARARSFPDIVIIDVQERWKLDHAF